MTTIRLEAPSHADLVVLHAALAQTYWSPNVPFETVARACEGSTCAIARDDGSALVGFARVVSDKATFAWLCDVIVLEGHRGKGLARSLVAALQASPDLQGLRRWLLATRDAHGVYAPLGFQALAAPERWMEISQARPYGAPRG